MYSRITILVRGLEEKKEGRKKLEKKTPPRHFSRIWVSRDNGKKKMILKIFRLSYN